MDEEGRKERTRARVFEEEKDRRRYIFTKEVFDELPTHNASALTAALSNPKVDQRASLPGNRNSLNLSQNEARLVLKVFPPNSLKFIKIRVSERTTVEQVIIEAVRLMADTEGKETDINRALEATIQDPKAYLLKFAEDDGTPDDDMPSLVRTQEIGQFKACVTFALCQDPKYTSKYVWYLLNLHSNFRGETTSGFRSTCIQSVFSSLPELLCVPCFQG